VVVADQKVAGHCGSESDSQAVDIPNNKQAMLTWSVPSAAWMIVDDAS